jgi:hypothetical protein
MCIRRVGPQCAERPGPCYNEGRLLTRLAAGVGGSSCCRHSGGNGLRRSGKRVLSNEVAHIVRGDFVAWFVAQLGVVLHFYNPLVHWTIGR